MSGVAGVIDKIVADIQRGKRAPVYLLYGDEFLAREGARAVVNAVVPEDHQALSVEVVGDEDAASVAGRLRTVPLFGGIKVVVVHDTKAFVSKQNAGMLFTKSLDTWKEGKLERSAEHLLRAVAAAGQDRAFLERAAKGDLPAPVWEQVLGLETNPESEGWLRETAGRLLTVSADVSKGAAAATAQIYEDLITQGIPPEAVLIVTADVVDQRRALFKRIAGTGIVVDCGVRSGKVGETQMKPELARARIKDVVIQAGRRISDDAIQSVVERTGFSMRGLESELEKILLYVGDRTEIDKTDVLAVLSNSREASIFDLTNALEERDAAGALRALRALAVQREAAQPILGMLASTIRGLILARWALDRRLEGHFDSRMPYAMFQARVLPRLTADAEADDGSAARIREMHPFRAFNLFKAAGRFAEAELVRGLSAVHAADLALKTAGQPEHLTLETLALSLCGGGAAR
jgi:DNA polymerase-3 subunit delta